MIKGFKRRKFIKYAIAIPTMPILGLLGCGGNNSSSTTDSSDDSNGSDNGTTDNGSTTDSSSWKSGGTDLISVEYPDDSILSQVILVLYL